MGTRPTYEELELRVKELEIELVDAKQAEQMPMETQNIKQLLSVAPFGVYLMDLSGKIVACNERGAEHLGKTIETSIGTVLREYFPAEVAENRRLKGMEAIKLRQAVTFEDHVGGRWYRNSIFPIFDDEGRPVRLAIYGADVTEYKNALDALEKSEDKYRQLSDLLPQVVFETDEKGNLTFTNHMAFDLFDYRRADFEKGLNALQMLIPEDRERASANMQKIFRGDKLGGTEYTALTKGGRTYPVMICSNLVINEGKPVGLRGIMVDLTEVKRAQEALRESEEKYRILVEQSPLAVSLIGKDGRYRYLNPKFTEIFGYILEEIPTGKEWFKKAYPDQEYRRQVIWTWINDQKEAKIGEARPRTYVVKCKDGSEKTINFKSVTLETGEQFVICEDITESKRAEEALRESEEKFRFLTENMADIVWTLDQDFRTTYVSPSIEKILGFTLEERKLQTLEEMVTPESLKRAQTMFLEELQKDGEDTADLDRPVTIEVEYYHKDGSTIWMENRVKALRDQAGVIVGMYGSSRNITERKQAEGEKARLEAQLQQAQKMEAIGTLAGGIAHDFNNILGAIMGHAELGKMKLPEESEAIDNLDQVLKAGNRAAKLVKQILTISRQHQQEQRPVQIKYVVREVLKLLRATLPSTIEIKEDLIRDTGIINADSTQMHQVIMNLCTNAGHAMQDDGGVLEVSLANVELDDLSASKHLDLDPGSYLRLTVSDTGHGMRPEIMERIFDPYYTTKDTGEGTGLGLSVAQGIVKAHGGTITFYSEPGKGTSFHVYLPVVLEEEREKKESEGPLPTGSERILFIDDEQVLLEIGSQVLERLGYEVVTQRSSTEALELFGAEPDRFDLVITDMTMPHMTGDKLAQELIKIRPNIPVILCTGHSRQISEEKAKGVGIRAFVMKPVSNRVVAELVRKVLDEK